MKKPTILILMTILCFSLYSRQCLSETIDEITISGQAPYIVSISGTYSDACDRNTQLQTVPSGEQVIINIFVEQLYPPGFCPAETIPYDYNVEITSPGDNYEIIVSMYQGTLGVDANGILLDSKTLQVGSDSALPDPLDEPTLIESEIYVDVHPEVINLNRRGRYIGAVIKPPEGYSANDIDTETLELGLLINGGESPTVKAVKQVIAKDKLIAKFKNDEVIGIIPKDLDFPDIITFFVRGEVKGESAFIGKDDAKIINLRNPLKFLSHLKQKHQPK